MTTQSNKPEPGTQDEMRAAFEAEATQQGFDEECLREQADNYIYTKTADCWKFFQAGAQLQASRVAPVVRAVPDDAALDSALYDAMAEQLNDLYSCGRVWSAWSVGTMSEDDFSIASEDSDIVSNFVSAARVAMLAAPSAPQAVAAPDRDAVLEEAARIIEDGQETIVVNGEDGVTNQKIITPRKAHNLMGLAYAEAIRELKQAPQPIVVPADMATVTKKDGNDYCRILTLLGMEEDGDPVAEIARLVAASRQPSPPAEHSKFGLTAMQAIILEHAFPGTSQQPVPSLNAYRDLLNVIANRAAGMAAYHDVAPHTCKEIADAIRMTDATQLVQQRATLSDTAILAEIEIVRDALGLTSLAFLTDGAAIAFARAILAARSAA